jgi:hypothetical protein
MRRVDPGQPAQTGLAIFDDGRSCWISSDGAKWVQDSRQN